MSELEAKVIDLQAFRTRKTLIGERKSGLHQTFQPSKNAPASVSDAASGADLSDRIERIKSSISRINQLMTELRSLSNNNDNKSK